MVKNYGFSLLRFVAMVMIVVCHILQSRNNDLCYYFNVGVFIFLFLSGYLYGGKRIDNIKHFYKKQILKIYIPYIFILSIILIVDLCFNDYIDIKEIISSLLCLQWYKYSIPNCGHLWYVSCILFCYLLIPVLQKFSELFIQCSKIKKYLIIFALIVAIQILNTFGGLTQEACKISCFIVGYLFSNWKLNESKIFRNNLNNFYLLISLLLFAIIYALSNKGFTLPSILLNYIKFAIGMFSVLVFNNIKFREIKAFKTGLDINDKYSYGIYLCHHIFILGSLSCMSLTRNFPFNILLAITGSITLAVFVTFLSNIVIDKINKLIFIG